jgi:protein involved in polysaccharide export with SLBB domain
MKSFISYRSIVLTLLIAHLFQIMVLPIAQAQGRGIFVRESDQNKEGTGTSFRTEGEEEEALPGALEGRGGLEGALQQKKSEGLEGSKETLGVGGLIYQIHILGEVKRPGTYRIPASTRLSEALQLAGGLKKNGSERNVDVRRPGGASRKLDLTAYKLFGKLENNPYLMDNDVVYVPLKQKVIEVEGAVNRPGIYEVKNEKTLSDAIRLAGGFSQGVSHKDSVRIVRYEEEKKEIVEVENTEISLKQKELLDGDVIVVPHIFTTENTFDYNLKKLPNDNIFYPSFEDRVFIIGAVEVPGAYNFNQYYRLPQYLALAGGMNRMAKHYVKVVGPDGKTEKVKPDSEILINPGDTLYVPEKALSRETYISILSTLASLGLSATAIFTR